MEHDPTMLAGSVSAAVPDSANLLRIARKAGQASAGPDAVLYAFGRLYVAGVTQQALDAALAEAGSEPDHGWTASPRSCTPREFRARFTADEKGALTLAASKALEGGDPTLQVFLDDLSASQVVELDHPDLIAGMDALVAAKLLTRKRANAILAG